MKGWRMKSIPWTCEYKKCNKTFSRYAYQVKKGSGRFCCQSHASLEQAEQKKSKGYTKYIYKCQGCSKEFSAMRYRNGYTRKLCQKCSHLGGKIQYLKNHSDNFDLDFNIQDYWKLLNNQKNKCAMCKKPENPSVRFAIDHDHKTGKIRGLLCSGCNRSLGWFENNKDSVLKYIK